MSTGGSDDAAALRENKRECRLMQRSSRQTRPGNPNGNRGE
jgi:hypothetical protein